MEDTVGRWRKSSYSGNGGSSCVEVGNAHQVVMVRDTKARTAGTLAVSADDWRQFTERLKTS